MCLSYPVTVKEEKEKGDDHMIYIRTVSSYVFYLEQWFPSWLVCTEIKCIVHVALPTMLVSCSEYPRDNQFLPTMVSYFLKNRKAKKNKKNEPFQSYLLTGQA